MSELKHYGTPRHSGRYPWGSGENPHQRYQGLNKYVADLRKQGMKDTKIAESMGISTTQLRARMSISRAEQRAANAALALRLKDKGMSNTAIGKQMGINESSVRSLLDPALKERSNITFVTANMLKKNLEDKQYLDVGTGVELYLGVSRDKLNTAIEVLKDEGYKIQYVKVEQAGNPGKYTSIKVLTPPDTTYSELYKNQDKIKGISDYSEDGGRSYLGLEPPRSVDRKRVEIAYSEDGGADKDGSIELRRGVDDISLGDRRYAQVRIAVDDKYYMKGMAIYSDDLPEGIDIRYNTNKKRGTPDENVFKPIKDDPDNPFGSTVRQKHYIDANGKKQLSSINIVGHPTKEGSGEEGSWDTWSKTLSSQFLSKQPISLIKKQLGLAYDLKQEEFDEIMSLTNPAVKRRLLMSFSDDCDSSAVNLKAAALPRQANKVLIPVPELSDTEVYAPTFRNGERVVLIRHPHGGKFEIPELTVNNKHKQAKSRLGQAEDGIGINPKVAERLSGADFDGDTVLVIPNPPSVGIRTSAPLKGLKNFDPKEAYPGYEGMKRMTKAGKQKQMGDASNLITDMTIKGATPSELAAAVRHSMVVIDAEKHGLNYRQSYKDNRIAELKERYQGGKRAGASTLISKASSDERVLMRNEKTPDKLTGKRVYEYTGESYIDKKTGKLVYRRTKSTKMAEVEDAFELSSGTAQENTYASHANKLKALANSARKEAVNIEPVKYSPSAKQVYAKEVATLDHKLNVALKNAPLERQAQVIAKSVLKNKMQANPGMDNDDIKKVRTQALAEARSRTGADKQQIPITPREWEAIQAGAITQNKLTKILNNTDLDLIKQYATPRTKTAITPAKEARVKAMLSAGYSQSDIADALGISTSTVSSVK